MGHLMQGFLRSRRAPWIALAPIVLALTAPPAFSAEGAVGPDCAFKGVALKGRVQIVESFPDIKVRLVSSFPDLKVKIVESFPDACGKWTYVESFPDFKVQFVTSFPDIDIQLVESFPGLP